MINVTIVGRYRMTPDIEINQRYRFWFGSGFVRTGTAIAIDDDMVLVKWDYNLPNSWERIDRIC